MSFTFGADVVSKFLNRHDLDLICRAHQVTASPVFTPRFSVLMGQKVPAAPTVTGLYIVIAVIVSIVTAD